MFLDQLNTRIAVKKQANLTNLDKLVSAIETQTYLESTVFKSGIKGMHRGVHKDALANLHKRADIETGNSQRLMAGNYPTGYHADQSRIHEDLADALRSHGMDSSADYHDRLAVVHDKKANGDGSGLRQNKVSKSSGASLDDADLEDEYEEILKGLGKGSGRGRPKGSKNKPKNGGGVAPSIAAPSRAAPSMAAPKTNITGDAGLGHNAEDVAEAFNAIGKHGGGNNFTSNVIVHKDKAQAEIHAGAMHGYLKDAGYKESPTYASGTTDVTQYEHPSGDRVTLNMGSSGSKNFVGYHHSTQEARNSDFGTKPSKVASPPTVEASKAPKGLPKAAQSKTSAVGADGKVSNIKLKRGLAKIAEMTHWNDHNEAMIHGAKLLGRDDLAAKMQGVKDAHEKLGHMSGDLISARAKVYNELHDHAKSVLTPTQAHDFHMSF